MGKNLYTKGAAYAALTLDRKADWPYLYEGSYKVQSDVRLEVTAGGQKEKLPLARAGQNWFDEAYQYTAILRGTPVIRLLVTQGGERKPKVCDLELEDIWKRPEQTRRISISGKMTDVRSLHITVKDTGFGSIFIPRSPSPGNLIFRFKKGQVTVMGELILCTYKTAERPFVIPDSGFEIYTLEELCYYLEDNFYLLDKKVLNYSLCRWLSQEIGLFRLSVELEKVLRSQTSVYPGALLIMKKSGFYREEELEELGELFRSMDGKTVLECRKVKGDQYLKQEKYALAAAEYRRLLKPENRMRMTDELRGFLYHNLGVAYARMFLFPEAAECFREAYQQNRRPESREACLYALNYIKGDKGEDQGSSDESWTWRLCGKYSENSRTLLPTGIITKKDRN